ncbi:MAG: hypothetical protein KGH88_06170 [Thaumarchaeota archaeon]|nr:hypothetical protein [Nitrososphaerota archaeon]
MIKKPFILFVLIISGITGVISFSTPYLISSSFALSQTMGAAFAESDNNNNTTNDQNETGQQQKNEPQSEDNNLQLGQESNKTQSEHQSEDNQQSSNENNQNKTEVENQPQANQEGIDEINNENNNEKATHQENQQDENDIGNAVENKTVAAEVNIGTGLEETKPIDSNIDVHTNSTSDAVSVTVDSKTESGPKVVIFNLNSTTIDVSNVKYLHVTYDGHSIAPATDVNAVLHPKSTDEPSYAIIITQNGAQVLVSIPHFSSHTITLSQISKVIPPPVPEFPFAVPVLLISAISAIVFSRMKNKIQPRGFLY